MATIYKIARTWYLNYTIDGKRIRKRIGRSREIAELALKDIEVKLAKKEAGLLVRDIKLDKFLEEYTQYSKVNHRPRTFQRYQEAINHFRTFLKDHEHVKKLSQLTPRLFEQFKEYRLQKAQKRTVNFELKTLKYMLNLAIKWGYLKANPIKDVAMLRTMGPKYPHFFSKEEVKLILENSPERYRPVFQTLLYTGMRRDELRFLEVPDIDFGKKIIKVRAKEGFSPKTAEREIPIHKDLEPILRRVCGDRKEGLVFPNENGKVYDQGKWRKVLLDVFKKCGIKNATLHHLRHTCASWLVMAGVDLPTIGKILGHTDISTTMIYSHLAKEHLAKAINRLEF